MKIGLDVDGVLSDFAAGFIAKAKQLGLGEHYPCCAWHVRDWGFGVDPLHFKPVWETIGDDAEFWLNLPLIAQSAPPIPFVPAAYITSRRISSDVTAEWLMRNGFPKAETVTVTKPDEKLAVVQRLRLDIFVDDYTPTVRQLRKEGIDARLFAAPYQCGEDISDLPRIYSLWELMK